MKGLFPYASQVYSARGGCRPHKLIAIHPRYINHQSHSIKNSVDTQQLNRVVCLTKHSQNKYIYIYICDTPNVQSPINYFLGEIQGDCVRAYHTTTGRFCHKRHKGSETFVVQQFHGIGDCRRLHKGLVKSWSGKSPT